MFGECLNRVIEAFFVDFQYLCVAEIGNSRYDNSMLLIRGKEVGSIDRVQRCT